MAKEFEPSDKSKFAPLGALDGFSGILKPFVRGAAVGGSSSLLRFKLMCSTISCSCVSYEFIYMYIVYTVCLVFTG